MNLESLFSTAKGKIAHMLIADSCLQFRQRHRTKLFALSWGKFARKLPNQITSLEKVFVG